MLGRAITLTHKGARWTKCHKEHVQRLPNRMTGLVLSGMYLAWETPTRNLIRNSYDACRTVSIRDENGAVLSWRVSGRKVRRWVNKRG